MNDDEDSGDMAPPVRREKPPSSSKEKPKLKAPKTEKDDSDEVIDLDDLDHGNLLDSLMEEEDDNSSLGPRRRS